ncbi:xanthine dehydrogenase family protein molybdopterin-binding subunit [Ktedonospora formicarum]|uniref:Acylaldehyde oxidase n=1 Tax=Ktedonospora formicarum TaxID=2778364 RepID=A0A8J3I7J9_9CHLR|nr:xanthine dehydrogenase family protein molybdopterin-binding subunit [Ktedonospora formicarum]GHO47512.1 acylaldehyde oxidase [Ktedonospora formicarum]
MIQNAPQTSSPSVGQPVDRVDGLLKVTGQARYPAEFPFERMAHAVIVQSTIARGSIKTIETAAAEVAPGVLAVLTHLNAPRLHSSPPSFVVGTAPPPPLQDQHIFYHGQHIAVVVAETLEQATFAATLITVDYQEETPLLRLDDPRAQMLDNAFPDVVRGEPETALATAPIRVEEMYTTPTQHHNPLAPAATIANWDGETLTLHDSTQGVYNTRAQLAMMLDLEITQVRVLASFIGGAFGSGLRPWPHVVLAAISARQVGRPVKLVLTREQMYTTTGYRPRSVQRVALGATREGQLLATIHEGTEPVAMNDDFREGLTRATALLYSSPHLRTAYRQVRLNVAVPTWMRGPGESTGLFALESALDELAYALDIDPLELRLRNDTPVHPQNGKPWSSRKLRECFELGSQAFGWERRPRAPRSLRDGHELIGWGVSGSYYPYNRQPAEAHVRLLADGSVLIQTSATDIGPGTATILAQIASDVLGLPLARIRCELGDSNFPASPHQGGSMLAASAGSAVHETAAMLLEQALELVQEDEDSPLCGASRKMVLTGDGYIALKSDLTRRESYTAILRRHGLDMLEATGQAAPGDEAQRFGTGIFGAKFAEVRVDAELGRIRVSRVLSVIAAGRILNQKTARSQVIGGTVGGIGMALLEQTCMDETTGRIVNANFADYAIPVHADIPPLEVLFVEEPDLELNPLGVKGVGEIAIVGIAPAIANAIYHATGRRVRDLPITMNKL